MVYEATGRTHSAGWRVQTWCWTGVENNHQRRKDAQVCCLCSYLSWSSLGILAEIRKGHCSSLQQRRYESIAAQTEPDQCSNEFHHSFPNVLRSTGSPPRLKESVSFRPRRMSVFPWDLLGSVPGSRARSAQAAGARIVSAEPRLDLAVLVHTNLPSTSARASERFALPRASKELATIAISPRDHNFEIQITREMDRAAG